jgi:hypothetical protein
LKLSTRKEVTQLEKLSGQEGVVYPRSLVRINFESATLSFHTSATALGSVPYLSN